MGLHFLIYEEHLVKPAIKIKKVLDSYPKIDNVYVIAIVSCISGVMFGFDISSMSAFLGTDQYREYFDYPSSDMQGFITASMALGSFFGSLCCTFVSEPLGRRITLILCSLFWMIGAAIQSSVQNRAQLIIGRFIGGFGVGFGSSVAPVYGSEMAPRKIRGLIGGIFQFSVTLGILIMFYISYGCSQIDGIASFRLAWGLQIVPGLLLFLGCIFLPESPRWLAKQGFWDDAEDIVARIQAKGNKEDPDVIIEVSEIKEQIMLEENIKAFTYVDLFSKKYIRRTFTAVFAQIWQQLTGMNVLMYYITYIFSMAGYEGNQMLVSSSIQYIINTVVTAVALLLLDKLGRRRILLIGGVLMMAWLFAIGGLFAQYSEPWPDSPDETVTIRIPDDRSDVAKGIIACCYLFVASFAITWGVGVWGYVAELWGDSASRQRGAALATAANWIMNFAIAMFTPPSFKNISWKTYFIYATFCGCMTIHVYFGFPETKNKRLEEIGQMWDENVLPWKSSKWQPHIPILSDHELSSKMNTDHKEFNSQNSHSSEENAQV